ncbi:hypothetical protein MSAN_01997400 [Mycena sanguinolenta]|uniref:Uncharacterized protein n=1 Tax=Mycena sanguinolenta TaxID=230812 RepID=A0A8H6XM52_9AGAR|nr:hypothetical protein MSAN_01997400 [Mycena sanguinolenta]
MVRCPGCQVECKGGKGLTLHLRLSTNEACHAIFTTAESHVGPLPPNLAYYSGSSSQEHDQGSDTEIEKFGDIHIHGLPHGEFRGDFFGENYLEEDFGYDPADHDPENSDGEASDDEDDDLDVSQTGLEDVYEVPRPVPDSGVPRDTAMPGITSQGRSAPTRQIRKAAEDRFHHQPIIEKYPGCYAGMPISSTRGQGSEEAYRSSFHDSAETNPYAPFKSKMDWEIGKWAKLRGAGSTAFTDLLKIGGVREALDLSYGTSVELNKIIDEKLPGRPKFTRSEVVVNGEVFQLYSRDILECVRALWGDADFAPYLFVVPEKHYIDKDKTIRMYHNMHTGKWWWSTQEAVERDNPGATIIPIIISSDKTQLTVFGNKTAYPVYMTIGNIPKEIRRKPSHRAYVLLGYLPTSRMKNVKNKSARRRILANVFHACTGVYGDLIYQITSAFRSPSRCAHIALHPICAPAGPP